MSFVTAQSPALTAAATQLQHFGTAMAAQNTAAATPTTAVAPAAADPVSALQAMQFSAYGTWYQQVSQQAQAIPSPGVRPRFRLIATCWQGRGADRICSPHKSSARHKAINAKSCPAI